MRLTTLLKPSLKESTFQKGKTYGGSKCEGGCYVGKNGLMKLIKISKENPKDVFKLTDDNSSGLKPHYISNGVIAKATTLNPAYDLGKNKVNNLKVGNDVILSFTLIESLNESKSNLNEASEVDFNTLQPNKQKQVLAIEKIIGGKHTQIFEGIHGTIVELKTNTLYPNYRFDVDVMKKLISAKVRWVEADGSDVSVGF